ncbi:DNA-binding transcriptional ArsR family regulator [Kibdelosporangium banguiense]|uniref:DNA-binding transcriptional ArsR family regulator n=1 Tax=Kibdelosporangium banguiense TaxID=1365924 RepID=A0ABS4TJV6_9PSEU|nr:helix-turn-helix domain-containing protein [Kibdelosporangium banguiense]MBP2324700.1 DNA-binding transcriptional ArsR family regulator [Kibdelosporangium banguiense]
MRIQFTTLDLARTHLADDPDPLWELVNSLQALQSGYDPVTLGRWRRQAAADLREANLGALVRYRLFPVAPHASYFPDLLTPAEGTLGLAEGIDTILHTPRRRLAAEFGRLEAAPGAGAWLDDLRVGRTGAMTELGDLLRAYHRRAIVPYWARLRAGVHRDLAMRRQLLRDGGVERLLDSFRPIMRWRNPVLEFARHPSEREIRLNGRGLRLVPSYFARLNPVTIFDAELPQVVVYPVAHLPGLAGLGPVGSAALAQLLGDTRANVLRAVADGCTTTTLARRANTSLASASRHAAVLRAAGLVMTIRSGASVSHSLTPLGMALLNGGGDPTPVTPASEAGR